MYIRLRLSILPLLRPLRVLLRLRLFISSDQPRKCGHDDEVDEEEEDRDDDRASRMRKRVVCGFCQMERNGAPCHFTLHASQVRDSLQSLFDRTDIYPTS